MSKKYQPWFYFKKKIKNSFLKSSNKEEWELIEALTPLVLLFSLLFFAVGSTSPIACLCETEVLVLDLKLFKCLWRMRKDLRRVTSLNCWIRRRIVLFKCLFLYFFHPSIDHCHNRLFFLRNASFNLNEKIAWVDLRWLWEMCLKQVEIVKDEELKGPSIIFFFIFKLMLQNLHLL